MVGCLLWLRECSFLFFLGNDMAVDMAVATNIHQGGFQLVRGV